MRLENFDEVDIDVIDEKGSDFADVGVGDENDDANELRRDSGVGVEGNNTMDELTVSFSRNFISTIGNHICSIFRWCALVR